MKTNIHKSHSFVAQQRGVSTLVITLLLLVILSLVVLFSTSVGFFEQRTANNENRARIAEQAAETGISMAGEYIKASRNLIISNQTDVVGTTDGWLAAAGEAGWITCNGISNTATLAGRPHPCRSEANTTRRNQLWFFSTAGGGSTFMPYGAVGNVGGTAAFPSTVNVQAVLCRIDSSLSTPVCVKNPSIGNRVAITFISHATLTGENSQAVIKETWSSYADGNPTAAVPLIGSGFVKGLGNAQIVTSPNAGGYGVPASIWSPNNVRIGSGAGGVCPGGGGVGSVSTCQLGEYLKDTPEAELKTTCITSNTACGCPAVSGSAFNFLSGHSAATKKEGLDVLDVDNNDGTLPDVTYFPGVNCAGTNFSDIGDNTDDSLFEFTFGASNVVNEGATATNTNCTGSSTNCASAHLIDNLGAEVVTCAALNTLGINASGLYYVQGTCDLGPKIGSPTSPAIVVLEGNAKVNNTDFFGMLFLRSNNQTAQFMGVGNSHIIGSLVVEGEIDIAGTIDIIYDNTGVSTDPNKFPSNAKFARVPGSWLDATEGF